MSNSVDGHFIICAFDRELGPSATCDKFILSGSQHLDAVSHDFKDTLLFFGAFMLREKVPVR